MNRDPSSFAHTLLAMGICAAAVLSSRTAEAQITCSVTIPPSYAQRGITSRDTLIFAIVDQQGQPVPSCSLKVELSPVANSYGHQHVNPTRPIGTLNPNRGNTGSNGLQFVSIYTADDVSGQVVMLVSGEPPGGMCAGGEPYPPAFAFGMCVQIDGLITMPADSTYTLIGQTVTHPSNHYATPAMRTALQKLALNFYQATSLTIGLNDVSVIKGGLFDYQATWVPPHSSHRLGVDADIALMPVEHRRRFLAFVGKADSRLRRIIEPPPLTHYHLRYR